MNNNIKCHVCESINTLEIDSPQSFKQVTSDCRPWNSKLYLQICKDCGTAQKIIDDKWVSDAEVIYSKYQVYSQGSGNEQAIFDSSLGKSFPRSERIVQWLSNQIEIKTKGSIIDIGCGNGSFLKEFQKKYQDWTQIGLELDDRNEKIINSIPNTRLLVSKINEVNEKFDVIVLIHALEHIINPALFLNDIKKILNPGGILFIEIPNLKLAPFDILIADHCSHFTIETLEKLLNNAGFSILNSSEDYIPKEITLVAKLNYTEKSIVDYQIGFNLINDYFENLNSIFKQTKGLKSNFGIFGTSISATWLASEFEKKVSFFIDEDINRVGKTYMGKPVYSIYDNIENENPIIMPLRYDIAFKVYQRLENQSTLNFLLPPKL